MQIGRGLAIVHYLGAQINRTKLYKSLSMW